MKKESKVDIYIKDEGYADVRLQTVKVKKWAKKQGILNSWDKINKKIAYSEANPRGLYSFNVDVKNGCITKRFQKALDEVKRLRFKIESEF